MLLNTFPFLIFFLVVFILYWKIPKRFHWTLLLLAGYYFFASWKPAYLGIIIATTIINYYAAIAIHAFPRRKKQYVLLAVLFDLGILMIFKYLDFFTLSLSQILSVGPWSIALPQFKLLLPLGISFYTFQTIGYVLDVYWGKIKPEKHLGYFALFVTFFPQLSAGPISRAQELIPQLKKAHIFHYATVSSGLKLFAFGVFKKLVIADNLAVIVDRVFDDPFKYQGLSLVIPVVLFSWQLYADFSGYTDMSRGVARMLGVDLVKNFNLPYLATSVRDFWRRWHMSLSRWLRDYIYIPLGGSRHGNIRTILNTLIVFTLCGLWHGASWNFVVWGLVHGIAISVERIVSTASRARIQIPAVMKILYTYTFICISLVFFRANTIADSLYILRHSVVGLRNFLMPEYIWATLSHLFVTNALEMGIIFSLLMVVIFLEISAHYTNWYQILSRQHVAVRYSLYVLLIFVVIHVRNADIKEFIYIRF